MVKDNEFLMKGCNHRSGFVHIVGGANVGKSTLLNYLVGYPLSIATHKPQTTRQNIVGIYNEADLQIVYLDTPGYLEPRSVLQEVMMRNVDRALVHSDILLWVVDVRDGVIDRRLAAIQRGHRESTFVLLNKIDLLEAAEMDGVLQRWRMQLGVGHIIPISARYQAGLSFVEKSIKELLPIHPPYYPKEALTNRSERFLIADIIRKYIFLYYKQEIPYSSEVVITDYEDRGELLRLEATIYVERKSQKGILIGKGGEALKRVGSAARREIVALYKKKVFLGQQVRISGDWRSKKEQLAKWGYE